MSDGPLDAWSEVTDWSAEFAYSVTDDQDVLSIIDDRVVGASHTEWQVVASGRLVGSAFVWRGDGVVSGSWEEEWHADESIDDYTGLGGFTASGSGTDTGSIFLQMGITDGSLGVYSLQATGLRFEVTTTSWSFTHNPPGSPYELYIVSTGTREVFFREVEEAVPHSGLVLEGNKQIQLHKSDHRSTIAKISWTLSPLSTTGPCKLTGISPSAVTVFIGESITFTAAGTGLADVEWSAPGGTPPTGTGPMFTTKWPKTGKKTVTATCGGTSKSVKVIVLGVDIEINREITDPTPPSAKENIVQVKCDHPPRRFEVPCRIRLTGPATAPVTIVLTNPDGRLRFPNPGDTTRTVLLPANGAFTAFEITGEHASAAKGDAKIWARRNTATGRVVTEKKVTVFTFDQAQILLKPGGNYRFVGNTYTVQPVPAVSFEAKGRLRPAGLDCTAPQITNLRIAIAQDNRDHFTTINWDTPTIQWAPGTPSNTQISVSPTIRYAEVYKPSVTQPVNDTLFGASVSPPPVYDLNALKPPTGCAGAGVAKSLDTPFKAAPPSYTQNFAGVARVTWTRRVNITIAEQFRTFCGVYDGGTQFCALRTATWRLILDSNGPAKDQHAVVVDLDAAAISDPAPPSPTTMTPGIFVADVRYSGGLDITFIAATTEAECKAAGGVWDAATKTCSKHALLPSVPVGADQPLHDMRAVHDAVSLRLDAVDRGGGAWVVIKIIPAPHSGSATIIGSSIDIESGRMIDTATGYPIHPAAARGGIIMEGWWELIAPLSDSVMASRGQYSWTEPLETHARELKAEDLYNPFAQGGVIFCRVNPAAQGAAQFESVHLIPGGWETAIRPAYEAFKQSSQLFTTPSVPSHYAEFLGMLHGDNSVVAVMAFRTLAENRKVDIPSLRDALGRSEGYRQAAFVYLMLLQPGQIDKSALLSELNTVIGATSAEGHRPIAIAIAAARLLHPNLRMGQTVLTALRDRSTRLAAGMMADPYLRVVFEIMGIPAN